MKYSTLLTAFTVAALSVPTAFAQDMKPAPVKPAMNMEMDKQLSGMHEKMKTMQGQMEKIRKTTDAKDRQKLMQEHMQAMQENMKMMRGIGGSMMTGGSQHGSMKMGETKDGMMDGGMMKRHEMMEKRMDMMQMMMEQMLQHEQMMSPMPAK